MGGVGGWVFELPQWTVEQGDIPDQEPIIGSCQTEHNLLVLLKYLHYRKLPEKRELRKPQADF